MSSCVQLVIHEAPFRILNSNSKFLNRSHYCKHIRHILQSLILGTTQKKTQFVRPGIKLLLNVTVTIKRSLKLYCVHLVLLAEDEIQCGNLINLQVRDAHFSPYSVLRQAHSFLQSDFSTECSLFQFPASCLFLKVIQHLLTSSSSSSNRLHPSLYLSFSNMFQKAVLTQEVTNSVILPSLHFSRIVLS